MTEPTLDAALRNRLMRYLHTGNEFPKYFPGCWTTHKYYELDKLQAVNEAIAIGGDNPEVVKANCTEVVKIILKAYKEGWYTRFETIAFALAKCLLLGPPPVKEETYKAVAQVCDTTEQLMIFNRFTRILKTGNGRGWCKNIRQWYLSKEPMLLAKEVARIRSRYGRSHKTLLRKSHLKVPTSEHARDAVVKYAIFGLRRAKQIIGETEGTKEILDYIQKVEDIRHCEDPSTAAVLAEEQRFTLDHVPGHLLTSQVVWNAVLPQFTIEQLLYNIQRIHNMGFLTADSPTTAVVLSMLSNPDLIKQSKVTPLEAYITICNYKNKSRPMKHEKAKVTTEKEQRRRARQLLDPSTNEWVWTTTKRHPKEVKNWGIDRSPNPVIMAALNKLMEHTWLLKPPTKARYMITLDMRHHMFKGRHFCKNYVLPKKGGKKAATKGSKQPAAGTSGAGDANAEKKSKKHLLAECFFNKHVTPGHAAIILALQILKREKNVKLAVFTDEGVELVTIERNFSNIDEAEFLLRNAKLGRVQLDAPIEWATKNKHKVDVFINMVDRTTRYMELDVKERGGRGPGGRYGPPPAPEKEIPDHCPVRALERYRSSSGGVRHAKLIVMSLASHRVRTTDGSHEGVLDIVGVDEFVPKVIDAFVLGQFK